MSHTCLNRVKVLEKVVVWSGITNRPAGFYLPRQDFQALQNNESSNDGVGCGDSWDDIPGHSCKKDRHLPECGGHCCLAALSCHVKAQ